MKKFETPEIEIEKLEITDVITTSVVETPDDDCPNGLDWG